MSLRLLDTNILSDLMRNPQGVVADRIGAVGAANICTSIIVAAELRFGAEKKGSRRLAERVAAILDTLEVLPVSTPADAAYATIRTSLEKAGSPDGGQRSAFGRASGHPGLHSCDRQRAGVPSRPGPFHRELAAPAVGRGLPAAVSVRSAMLTAIVVSTMVRAIQTARGQRAAALHMIAARLGRRIGRPGGQHPPARCARGCDFRLRSRISRVTPGEGRWRCSNRCQIACPAFSTS